MIDPLVLHAFRKEALSAGLVSRLLSARAAQGARVGGKALGNVAKEVASSGGKAQASAGLRNMALNAGADVRAAAGARNLAARSGVGAERASLVSRGQQMDQLLAQGQGTVPLQGAVLNRGYSPGAKQLMTGPTVAAAPGTNQALAQMRASSMPAQTGRTMAGVQPSTIPRPVATGAPQAVGADAGTAVRKVRQRATPTPAPIPAPVQGTAATQLSPRPLMPQTGRTLSGPAMAYERTMLAPRVA